MKKPTKSELKIAKEIYGGRLIVNDKNSNPLNLQVPEFNREILNAFVAGIRYQKKEDDVKITKKEFKKSGIVQLTIKPKK